MKHIIKPVPCVCGCKTPLCIHGQQSGRVFILCPSCFRKIIIRNTEREATRAWNNGEIVEDNTDECAKISHQEIAEQFEEMTASAKRLIDAGEPASAFGFGIADAAATMGGKNPEHAAYCLVEAKKRITEIMDYAVRNERCERDT